MLAVASLFFLFSLSSELVSCDVIATSTLPRPHTGNIPLAPPRHHNYHTNLMAATTATTSPFAGSQAPAGLALTCIMGTHKPPCHRRPLLCLVHLKNASDKSFPLFLPFVFNGAGHLPSTQARCTPLWHASTHPTSPRVHAGRPFAIAVATTTTTSMPLRLVPLPRPPGLRTPPRPPSSPACQGVQEGHCAPSPLCPGYATRKGKGHVQGEGQVQGEGEGPGGMHARGRAAYKGRGRVCERAGLRTNRRGCAPFPHPLCPVD